ncbi:hypothetical protein SK128_026633 [Halocaridina rubra]|uniref:Uncharacterized protein n=1 Tax=Halocaridina rubra TaxID=373956 RepID=A0AAN9AB47_HALRR
MYNYITRGVNTRTLKRLVISGFIFAILAYLTLYEFGLERLPYFSNLSIVQNDTALSNRYKERHLNVSIHYNGSVSTDDGNITSPDDVNFITITLDPCNCQRTIVTRMKPSYLNNSFLNSTSSCGDWATARGFGQKVVCYTVFGPFPSPYYLGILYLMPQLKKFYPGWTARVYHALNLDVHEQKMWLCQLACHNPHLDFCDVRKLPDLGDVSWSAGQLWRFIALGDVLVERFMSRETDGPILKREVDAVAEWIESGKCFHVMHDAPTHAMPMLAGTWAGCNTWKIPLFQSIRWKMLLMAKNAVRKMDQPALKALLWPKIMNNITIHDSYNCKMYPGSRPFPSQRENLTFVGLRTFREKWRNDGVWKPCPVWCRPPDHQDWEYC